MAHERLEARKCTKRRNNLSRKHDDAQRDIAHLCPQETQHVLCGEISFSPDLLHPREADVDLDRPYRNTTGPIL